LEFGVRSRVGCREFGAAGSKTRYLMRSASLTLLSIVLSACPGATESAPSNEETSDGMGGPPCALSAGACGPADACCATVTGRKVDFDHNCIVANDVTIACVAASHPGARCVLRGETGCYSLRVDGGASEQTYVTPSIWTPEEVPALIECPDDLRAKADAAERTPCPP